MGSHCTPAQSWNQHRDLLAILRIFRVHLHQITLFQLNCDQDVRCRNESKAQMGNGQFGVHQNARNIPHRAGVGLSDREKAFQIADWIVAATGDAAGRCQGTAVVQSPFRLSDRY